MRAGRVSRAHSALSSEMSSRAWAISVCFLLMFSAAISASYFMS